MDREATLFEAINRINRFRREQPSLAKKYVDLLAELRSPLALPTLLECATDPAEIISKAAIRSLSSFDDPESTRILVEQARQGSERLRLFCLESLAEKKSPAVFALFRDLAGKDQELHVRRMAVAGLGNFDSDESTEFLLQCLRDSSLDIRTLALKSLLRLGVEEANEELEKMLNHDGPVRLTNGVKLLEIARWLPPLDLLQNLASHRADTVRIYLTMSLIAHLERDGGEQRQRAQAVLEYLLNDPRPDVRLKVLEGLYKAGKVGVANAYLRRLPRAVGAELSEAVEILTTVVKSPEAPSLIMDRFVDDAALTPSDRLVLLSGLATAAAPEAIDLFFEVIGGGWAARTSLVGEFTLDRHAAFLVHAFGPDVLAYWEKYLEKEKSDISAYLVVNGLRNLGDPRGAEALLALAGDRQRPDWIREEAIKSFAHLEVGDVEGAESVGEKLLKFHRESPDRILADLAFKVFWNYF